MTPRKTSQSRSINTKRQRKASRAVERQRWASRATSDGHMLVIGIEVRCKWFNILAVYDRKIEISWRRLETKKEDDRGHRSSGYCEHFRQVECDRNIDLKETRDEEWEGLRRTQELKGWRSDISRLQLERRERVKEGE